MRSNARRRRPLPDRQATEAISTAQRPETIVNRQTRGTAAPDPGGYPGSVLMLEPCLRNKIDHGVRLWLRSWCPAVSADHPDTPLMLRSPRAQYSWKGRFGGSSGPGGKQDGVHSTRRQCQVRAAGRARALRPPPRPNHVLRLSSPHVCVWAPYTCGKDSEAGSSSHLSELEE